jgi:hypothetical protein
LVGSIWFTSNWFSSVRLILQKTRQTLDWLGRPSSKMIALGIVSHGGVSPVGM